jgi:hypothetical protein
MRPLSLWTAATLALLLVAGCRTTAPPPPPPAPSPPPPPVEVPAEEPEAVRVDKPDQRFRPVPTGVYESQSHYPDTEVTEWALASGARLVFRPTRGARGRLAFRAFAPGGYAAVPDSLRRAAFPGEDLAGGAREGAAALDAEIAAQEVVLQGEAATGDLDVLFAAMHALVDAPVAGPPYLPVTIHQALDAALAGVPVTGRASDRDETALVYERLFGDPRRFTFVVAGDATAEAVEQAAARVLPRMRPSFQALLAPADSVAPPARIPATAERWTLPRAADPGGLAVAFRGRIEPGFDALAALDVLAALLADEIGGDARASAELHFDAGVGEVRLWTDGEADAEAEAEIFEAVRALRDDPPSDRALARARGALREAHEERLETPEGWAAWLARLYRHDLDPREVPRYGRRLGGVTAERVHRAARAVLDPDRFVLVRTADD